MGTVMLLLTLIGGITISAQSSVNGKLSSRIGTIETTLFTFIIGAMFLFILILFFGSGEIMNIFNAPKWQLSAVFLGTLYGLLIIASVPRIGVIAANISAIAGQLIISLIVDHFGWFNSLVIPLDTKRILALFFIILALFFIYMGNKKSSREEVEETGYSE